MLKAQCDARRSTTISLNYAIDQAIARNFGGGKPDDAVLASVREIESLQVWVRFLTRDERRVRGDLAKSDR